MESNALMSEQWLDIVVIFSVADLFHCCVNRFDETGQLCLCSDSILSQKFVFNELYIAR